MRVLLALGELDNLVANAVLIGCWKTTPESLAHLRGIMFKHGCRSFRAASATTHHYAHTCAAASGLQRPQVIMMSAFDGIRLSSISR